MLLMPFSKLPEDLRCDEVKVYYDILKKKSFSLFLKRFFDIIVSLFLVLILILPMVIISVFIKATSKGAVIYKQERVTTYGRKYKIWKFRTMVTDADKIGSLVTTDNDSRITSIGKVLRKFRLDELPQVFHVLSGKMSFVGTRPEVTKYTSQYTNEMKATLLLPAGVTSLASIKYKDEAELLKDTDDVDKVYVNTILPDKMKYNLLYIKNFSFTGDIKLIFKTVLEVFASRG